MNIDTMCNYDNSCNTVAEEESLTLFQQIYHSGSFILFKLVEGTIPQLQLHLNSVCILTLCSMIIILYYYYIVFKKNKFFTDEKIFSIFFYCSFAQ